MNPVLFGLGVPDFFSSLNLFVYKRSTFIFWISKFIIIMVAWETFHHSTTSEYSIQILHSFYWCWLVSISCFMSYWVSSKQFSRFCVCAFLLSWWEKLSIFLESIYINILNENISWLLKHVSFHFLFSWLNQETGFLISWSQNICLISKFFWNIISYLRWCFNLRFMCKRVFQMVHAWVCMVYVHVLSEGISFLVKSDFWLFLIYL